MTRQNEGRNRFMSMIYDMMDDKAGRSVTAKIELGMVTSDGIMPDSYPEDADADDDYYYLEDQKLSEGDRVLVIWTDDEEMVVFGPLGGED